jgi:type IV pilus assembly protein PilB
MVNWIISQAVRQQASDIHISPEETYIQVRFRIDGRLREIPALPKGMLLSVISRIKIIAGMDIAVSRVPQDGRFSIRVENHEVHVRASVVPTVNGENAVLRLLDMSGGVPQLDRLGFQPEDAVLVKQAIARPHGLILTTGPTGSGKTTTLYAILGEISSPEINVSTLEDPVEYRLANIRQLQLNRKAGMTFAGGLRALLRQDPDVIMVGEIRDTETAAIAVQAALTGHKVLSTLHTNDSPGAVVRLLDMGVAPFLVSSVLVMIVAQRLVRTVCKHCAIDAPPSPEAIAFWGLTPEELEGATFRRGTGCQNCSQTGYSGRIGIYEVLVVDNLVKGLIAKGRSAEEMEADLTSRGSFRPLKQDAVRKVLAGLTTLEEAASVVMV